MWQAQSGEEKKAVAHLLRRIAQSCAETGKSLRQFHSFNKTILFLMQIDGENQQ